MVLKNGTLRNTLRLSLCLLMAGVMVAVSTGDADARVRKKYNSSSHKKTAVKAKASRSKSAPRATGTSSPRYADIILNPVTGEVYHEDSADAQRYPASLTKMMTLYLLFEALDKNKLSMGSDLSVSSYAASMPQTNLSLEPGDEIPVEVAIKALIVRSANDVSVVVAEALAGDVDTFARRMTAKARALGMNSTVFKNPNGLPNNAQHTTARDMAKLGIALKRDFPHYFEYFDTRQFSWNGVTYYTHNRVMLRYPGADGIKTGYIGASGFNVVTSVTRGGRPLVGVVMGGSTGAWRDNRMIELLDQSYQKIAERGAARSAGNPKNLPLAKNPKKAGATKGVASEDEPEEEAPTPAAAPAATPEQEPVASDEEASTIAPQPAAAPAVAVTPPAAKPQGNYIRIVDLPAKTEPKPAAAAPVVHVAPVQAVPPASSAPVTVAKPTVQAVPSLSAPPANPDAVWGIQVGAFTSSDLAAQAVLEAQALTKDTLKGAYPAVASPEAGGAPVFRARIASVTEKQAKTACQVLIAHSKPCFTYKVTN